MSMMIKTFFWKDNKPVKNSSDITCEVVDEDTGEVQFKGADLAVFVNGIYLIPEECKTKIIEEDTNKLDQENTNA
jgi:hypothetical protein